MRAIATFLTVILVLAPLRAWADNDSDYDRGVGVDKGRQNGTLTSEPTIEGKSFSASKGFGKNNCPVTFKFEKAEKGTFPYQAANGKLIKGVNVKITATCDWAKCNEECASVKSIQFAYWYDIEATGNKKAAEPDTEKRKARSGWNTPGAPSRGWRVDRIDDATDPYYGQQDAGSTTVPTALRDSPGYWDGVKSKGKEFLTCAVCRGAKPRLIACLRWGFSIDKSGNVAFDPTPAPIDPPAPAEAKDAGARWDGIGGNTKIDVAF